MKPYHIKSQPLQISLDRSALFPLSALARMVSVSAAQCVGQTVGGYERLAGGMRQGSPASHPRVPSGANGAGKEYQLKGYKYLKAEIFNNIRVGAWGGLFFPLFLKMKVVWAINVTRLL